MDQIERQLIGHLVRTHGLKQVIGVLAEVVEQEDVKIGGIFGSQDRAGLRCSFCGKKREQVANLIAGPGVTICVECVDLCNEIIAHQKDEDSVAKKRKGRKKKKVSV